MEETERLVRKFSSMVYRLAYARTGDREDAQDVTQEVFLRLVKAQPALRDDEHCRAWLLRVTVNCAGDLFRSPWRRIQPLDEALPVPGPEEGTRDGAVLAAVLALPAQYRAPVHLFYFEDMPVAEIAAAMGKSESAVKVRLFRARALLRETLKGEEYDV